MRWDGWFRPEHLAYILTTGAPRIAGASRNAMPNVPLQFLTGVVSQMPSSLFLAMRSITSFREMPMKDLPMLKVLRQTSEKVFVPLTIGYVALGAGRSYETAEKVVFKGLGLCVKSSVVGWKRRLVVNGLHCCRGGIRDITDPDGTFHSAVSVAAEYFRSGTLPFLYGNS